MSCKGFRLGLRGRVAADGEDGSDHELVITLEDGVLDGGFGEKIARYYGATDIKVLNYGAKKEFVDRYDIQELLRANHLTDEQIVEDILSLIG